MDELLQNLALRPEPWMAGEIVLNLTLAFAMGLFVAWVYKGTHRALSVSFSFVNTLVLVTMIMCLVMMVIGNNIARAFGLAGAMSIIRFRTVVKDTRDTAFVFFALAAGMAAGTGNLKIAAIGSLMIGLFIWILHWTRHGAVARNEFLLSFRTYPTDDPSERTVYLPVFERYFTRHTLVNVKSTRMGETLNLSFHVTMKHPEESDLLVSELSSLEGVQKVSLNIGDSAES
jgi:uncharacterized membrane protein YhiD involved in acid resistance